ncbi:hypothetical protein C8Q76DRAFT_799806 [Earliella scabrosa]|nr:hypothetical protein C8Q76DRAFT_799806 [Earliella scabrosa]
MTSISRTTPAPVDVKTLPRLTAALSDEDLPDDLLVYDHHGLSGCATPMPVHYARYYPSLFRDSSGFHGKRGRMRKHFSASLRNVAHLDLNSSIQLAAGPQATVLRAPLSLPHHAEGGKTVSIAVKVARGVCGAHQSLMEEGSLFSSVSRSLTHENDGNGDRIPNFYGCYLRVRKDGSMKARSHDEGCDAECEREVFWASPILLMEECEETVCAV